MPSQEPLPTIRELVKAGSGALTGERDTYGDTRSGSLYNHTIGPLAILFSREADRDQSMFSDIYFADADGEALTILIQQRTGIARILDTYGQGACAFGRTSSSAGSGTILQGTRIALAGSPQLIYQVTTDTSVSGLVTTPAVPIRAVSLGTGNATAPISSGLSLLDPVYDPLWLPMTLQCSDGTNFEDASTYRARVLATLQETRYGYLELLTLFFQELGASYVIGFASDFGLLPGDTIDDHGLNAIYIGDANYGASPQLLNECYAFAAESVRNMGCDLWIGGIAPTTLAITALITLVDQPSNLPLVTIRRACTQALLGYFGSTGGGWIYKGRALSSALVGASPYVQTASFPTAWSSFTAFTLGDQVHVGGLDYQVVTPGISGATLPAFPVLSAGQTVTDGSVTWVLTAYPDVGIYVNGALSLTDPTITSSALPASLPRYTLNGASIKLYFTGPI